MYNACLVLLFTFSHRFNWAESSAYSSSEEFPRVISKLKFATVYTKAIKGLRWAVGWGTALQAGRSQVRFPMESLEFLIDIILPAALRPWGGISL
jgi:hypothetical protein